jgi:Ca2+/H+ antiporter
MPKFLYTILLFITALFLYNWFFIPAKMMSNGHSEKEGFGTVTLICCFLSVIVGFLYYTGKARWASGMLYLIFIAGIVFLFYIISTGRWN